MHTLITARQRIDQANARITQYLEDTPYPDNIDFPDLWSQRVERVEEAVLNLINGQLSERGFFAEVVDAWETMAAELQPNKNERILASFNIKDVGRIEIGQYEGDSGFFVKRGDGTTISKRWFRWAGSEHAKRAAWEAACVYAGQVAGITEDPA